MRILSNLKLKEQFMVIAGLFLAFVVFASIAMAKLDSGFMTTLNDFMNHPVHAKMKILEVSADTNALSSLTRDIMLGSDMEKDMTLFREKREKIKDAFKEIIAADPTGEHKAMISDTENAVTAFLDKSYESLSTGSGMSQEERASMYQTYLSETAPLAETAHEKLSGLVQAADAAYASSVDTAKSDISKRLMFLYLIVLIVTVVLMSLLYLMYRIISAPIKSILDIIHTLAQGKGDLTPRIRQDTDKERSMLSMLSHHFNTYLDSVNKDYADTLFMVGDAGEHTMPVTTAIVKVRDSVENNVEMATQVAAAGEEMGATISEIANSANESAEMARSTVELAKRGGEAINIAKETSDNVATIIDKLESEIKSLTEKASEISNVISVINDISEQTNLLALNAAIEAARAGEAGRGFAVVADEVRKLAEKTQHSTKEIESMVGSMNSNINQVSRGALEVVAALSTQSDATENAYTSFQTILGAIEELNSLVTGISAAVAQQSATTTQIMSNVTNVAENSENTKNIIISLVDDTDRLLSSIKGISDKYTKYKLTSRAFYFASAKVAHINLMKGIFDCYSKNQCQVNIPDHTTCAFGQFYYNEGMQMFGNDSDYKAMESPHKAVHTTAHAVLDLIKAGRRHEADLQLPHLESLVKDFVSMLDDMIRKYK
ncbi:MAG: methyl-accepting chemotaxis protein [Deferribacterales bacterium]